MYLVDYLGTKVILYSQSYKRIFVHLTFSGCTSLESIVIGNSVTTIGTETFSGCKNLERVVIGKSLKTIGRLAFSGCKNLEIYVHIDFDKQRISYSAEKNIPLMK